MGMAVMPVSYTCRATDGDAQRPRPREGRARAPRRCGRRNPPPARLACPAAPPTVPACRRTPPAIRNGRVRGWRAGAPALAPVELFEQLQVCGGLPACEIVSRAHDARAGASSSSHAGPMPGLPASDQSQTSGPVMRRAGREYARRSAASDGQRPVAAQAQSRQPPCQLRARSAVILRSCLYASRACIFSLAGNRAEMHNDPLLQILILLAASVCVVAGVRKLALAGDSRLSRGRHAARPARARARRRQRDHSAARRFRRGVPGVHARAGILAAAAGRHALGGARRRRRAGARDHGDRRAGGAVACSACRPRSPW